MSDERSSERLRVPQPVMKSRIPSGRGAMEQPNVTGDGESPLTRAFWAAILFTGVATGLFGALMMVILFGLEHLTYGYHAGTYLAAVKRASDIHRVLALLIAGAVGGVGWYLLRRVTRGEKSEFDDAIWNGDGRLSFRRSLGSSAISEVVIGMGLDRTGERAQAHGRRLRLRACPLDQAQHPPTAAAGGLRRRRWARGRLPRATRRGALQRRDPRRDDHPTGDPPGPGVLVDRDHHRLDLPPTHATYLDVPSYHFTATILVWAVLIGPIIGLFAVGYIRLIAWISHHSASGLKALPAPLIAFTILGLIGIVYPQLFGNGKDMAHDAFLGAGTIGLLAALSILKPLVTSLCLGSGASGGLFTPVMSTGAVLGGALGLAWSHLWPGGPAGPTR